MEEFEVHIESLCRDHYLRNNKRGGLKNLRCFPECLPTGHHAKGFCGHRVAITTYSRDFLAEEALVLGRFSTRDDPLPEPDNLSLVLNNTYDAENVRQRVRDREDPLKEFVSSEKISEERLSDSHRVKTTFYFSPTSWHYGWRSSKHKKDQSHNFRVYLFTPSVKSFGYLTLSALSKTSDFTLSSSKRAKDGQEPAQQHLSVTQQDIDDFIKATQTARENKRRKKSNGKGSPRKRGSTTGATKGKKRKKRSNASSSSKKKKSNWNSTTTTTTTSTTNDDFSYSNIFDESDGDSDISSSRALLGTFLGWNPEPSTEDMWVPLSRRNDKNTARRHALQRLLIAVTKIDGQDDNNSNNNNNNNNGNGEGGSSSSSNQNEEQTGEGFLHGLLKGEFLDLSPFGTNDNDDILNFDSEDKKKGNDASILKGLASYMIDSNEMTAAISKFLHKNREDIENNQNMEKMYDDMLELCEQLIDEFLLKHGSSISHVLEIVQAKKKITEDLESNEGRRLRKQDLGLWILSACAPPMSPETTTVTYSPGAGSDSSPNLLAFPASNSISAFKGLDGVYDWHAVIDGDRDNYFMKCGVPWLARKLMKYMFAQIKVTFSITGKNRAPTLELQVRSRLGINSSLTFIGDSKIHLWPIQGGALFGLLESPNFGGEYVCNIVPDKRKVEIRHILKTKDETTITSWYDEKDDLNIALNYYNLVTDGDTGMTQLVIDEDARVHEIYQCTERSTPVGLNGPSGIMTPTGY